MWACLAKRTSRWIPELQQLQPSQKEEKETMKPQCSKTRFDVTCTSHIPNSFGKYNNTVPKQQQRQSQRAEGGAAARMMRLRGGARRVEPAERRHHWGGSVKASFSGKSVVGLIVLPRYQLLWINSSFSPENPKAPPWVIPHAFHRARGEEGLLAMTKHRSNPAAPEAPARLGDAPSASPRRMPFSSAGVEGGLGPCKEEFPI